MPVLQTDPGRDSLEVQVTEPAIFLRTSPTDEGEWSGALVCGVLTLTLANAVPISSIEVELEGHAATTWVEGVDPDRVEKSEEYAVYSASKVLFTTAPGIPTRGNDGYRAAVAPDDCHPDCADGACHSINDNNGQSTLASRGHVEDFPIDILNSRTSVDPSGSHDNPLDTRERRQPSQGPESTPSCTFTDLSNCSTSEGGSIASINASGSGISGLRVQPDLGSSNPIATIHQAQVSSLGRLPEINEENTMEEFYIPTTTSRSRSPEHHVPTNSHHDRRGRSPPERSFTTVTRVFDAIRERTARSLLSLSHPGFSSSRSMFTDRSERGGLPSTSQESSRILAGTNTSQVATDSLSCAATPGSGPEFTETFQRGVYNYPFHFNLPSNVPPTTKTEHGSFTWRLNASVKQNSSRSLSTLFIAACKEVEVVYSPSDDELGEISQTSDDMQWEGILDTDFEYRFTIPRNSNPLGEIFPVLFESQSLRRIRTFRIAVHVYLNEYLEYFSRSGVSVRTETSRTMITQFEHFSNTPPDVQTFGTSPWGIRTIPRLPDAMQGFHASTPKVNSEGGMQRNPKSNVGIHHSMEVHIRVEKGDDGAATGRDFFIHVPMRMLSNFCTGEWAALPRYPNSSLPSMESNSRSSHNRSTDRSTGRLSDFLNQQSNPGRESRVSLPFLPRSLWARTKPHRRVDGFSSCRELYERLVSGLESETGQCPPRYGKRKLQRRM